MKMSCKYHCIILINKIDLPFSKISRFCRHIPTEWPSRDCCSNLKLLFRLWVDCCSEFLYAVYYFCRFSFLKTCWRLQPRRTRRHTSERLVPNFDTCTINYFVQNLYISVLVFAQSWEKKKKKIGNKLSLQLSHSLFLPSFTVMYWFSKTENGEKTRKKIFDSFYFSCIESRSPIGSRIWRDWERDSSLRWDVRKFAETRVPRALRQCWKTALGARWI